MDSKILMRKKIKRRRYFVNRRLQLRFVGFLLMTMFLVALAAGLCVFLTAWNQFTVQIKNPAQLQEIQRILRLAYITLIPLVVGLILLSAYLSVFFSHRIAGPVFRMQRYMREIIGGDLSMRVAIRSSDELQDFASEMDNMVGILSKLLGSAKGLTAEIRSLAASGKTDDLKAKALELQEVLDRFTVREIDG